MVAPPKGPPARGELRHEVTGSECARSLTGHKKTINDDRRSIAGVRFCSRWYKNGWPAPLKRRPTWRPTYAAPYVRGALRILRTTACARGRKIELPARKK